ncbi:hypothetical protein GCM10027174_13860 [Salinifilum aidingensis]
MSDPTDPDQLLADYQNKLREAEAKSQRINEAIGGVQVTERSGDREVSVTVNSSGNLVDLSFGSGIKRRDPEGLAQEVLDCVNRAQTRASEQLREAVQPEMGDGAAFDFMLNSVTSAPSGSDQGAQQDTRPGPEDPDEDEDFGDGTWLRG